MLIGPGAGVSLEPPVRECLLRCRYLGCLAWLGLPKPLRGFQGYIHDLMSSTTEKIGQGIEYRLRGSLSVSLPPETEFLSPPHSLPHQSKNLHPTQNLPGHHSLRPAPLAPLQQQLFLLHFLKAPLTWSYLHGGCLRNVRGVIIETRELQHKTG